jgi:hypothetical protein
MSNPISLSLPKLAGHAFRVMRRGNFLFWVISTLILLLVVFERKEFNYPVFPGYAIYIEEKNLPHLIMFWALLSTAIYTYAYLLVPILERLQEIFPKDKTRAGTGFHWIFWVTAGLSTYIALGYFLI